MFRRSVQCLFASFLALGGAGAPAQEQPEIRRITQTEATSDCIGDPKTPLCAVETFIACGVCQRLDLCHIAGVRIRLGFDDRISAVEYRFVSAKTIRPEDVPQKLKDSTWYRPGFVRIAMFERACIHSMTACPSEQWDDFGYSVKPVGKVWAVVSWSGDHGF
jgi:hypothetical protein